MLDAEIMEGPLLDQFLEALRGLPEAHAELGPPLRSGGSERGYDARVDLWVGGEAATLLIEVKKALYPRDVRQALWQFQEFARRWPQSSEGRQTVSFLVAQSISPGAKDLLKNERVGYYDSGGSLFLPAEHIYVYVEKPPPEEVVEIHTILVFRSSCPSPAHAPDAAW